MPLIVDPEPSRRARFWNRLTHAPLTPFPDDATVADKPKGQGYIRRGWSDALAIYVNPYFVLVEIVVGVVVSLTGGAIAALVVAFIAGGVLAVMITVAPFRQRNEARVAHTEALNAADEARTEGERQLADARQDADRRVAEVERERDETRTRIEELEAPPDDPDPRIALANRAEHRAAQLRALCAKWEGRIAAEERQRPLDLLGAHATAHSDFLEQYEGEHSVETYEVFDELVASGVMDPEHRSYIEHPRDLDDLRTAAGHLQEAARQLREREPEPVELDPVQLLKKAYHDGSRLRGTIIRLIGAPTNEDALAEADNQAWRWAAEWAHETWQMLFEHFPGGHEREFFGSSGWEGFEELGIHMNAHDQRGAGSTVDEYMGQKLDILAALLEREGR